MANIGTEEETYIVTAPDDVPAGPLTLPEVMPEPIEVPAAPEREKVPA